MLRQKNNRIFIYFFLFFLVGSLNNKYLKNADLLKISKISVSGLEEKENKELLDNLNFIKVDNLFLINKDQIEEIISSNSLVETYSVFKKYPSTIIFNIKKTNFLAKIKKNDLLYLLGSNGKLIKIDKNENVNNIPNIYGKFKIEDFFKLKKIVDNSDFNYQDIYNLFYFKSGRWDIQTKSGLLIKLPRNLKKENFFLLDQIITSNQFSNIEIIDLRQNNQILINGK
tara:strand:- start:328 stop:1008 length:681 start_codon:yes stop_codon:yes gene_type:complete